MRRTRLPFLHAVTAILVAGVPVVHAGSTAAPLAVGVTVVRSCAVQATAAALGSARLDLTCARGAAAGVARSGAAQQPDGTLRLHMPTSPFRGSTPSADLEVVTLNF